MPLLFDFIDRQFIHFPPPVKAGTSFKGQTIIITGGSGGLGKEAGRLLVRFGAAKVILTCRNPDKGNAAVQDIMASESCSPGMLEVWPLNLSSYSSVFDFADRVKRDLPRVDTVLSNAGVGTRTWRESEGNEESITTNVITPTLLALLLLPKLRETAKTFGVNTRYSVTNSELYEFSKFKESNGVPPGQLFAALADKSKANMTDRYPLSKLLITLVLKELAARFPVKETGVIINSTAPGFCFTELHRDVGDSRIAVAIIKSLARPAPVGARVLAFAATSGPETHGAYMPDCKITPTGGLTKGEAGAELQQRLWKELSVELEKIRPGVTKVVW